MGGHLGGADRPRVVGLADDRPKRVAGGAVGIHAEGGLESGVYLTNDRRPVFDVVASHRRGDRFEQRHQSVAFCGQVTIAFPEGPTDADTGQGFADVGCEQFGDVAVAVVEPTGVGGNHPEHAGVLDGNDQCRACSIDRRLSGFGVEVGREHGLPGGEGLTADAVVDRGTAVIVADGRLRAKLAVARDVYPADVRREHFFGDVCGQREQPFLGPAGCHLHGGRPETVDYRTGLGEGLLGADVLGDGGDDDQRALSTRRRESDHPNLDDPGLAVVWDNTYPAGDRVGLAAEDSPDGGVYGLEVGLGNQAIDREGPKRCSGEVPAVDPEDPGDSLVCVPHRPIRNEQDAVVDRFEQRLVAVAFVCGHETDPVCEVFEGVLTAGADVVCDAVGRPGRRRPVGAVGEQHDRDRPVALAGHFDDFEQINAVRREWVLAEDDAIDVGFLERSTDAAETGRNASLRPSPSPVVVTRS
jgi:hypothetical protein